MRDAAYLRSVFCNAANIICSIFSRSMDLSRYVLRISTSGRQE